MKKILVVATYFHPHIGGVERYVEELYSRMADDEHEIHVLTISDRGERYEHFKGLHVHRVRSAFSIGATFVVPDMRAWNAVISRLLSEGRFCCVNTHTRFFATSFLAALAAKRFGVKHVHTEHGAAPVTHDSAAIRIGASVFDKSFGTFVFKNAATTITVSRKGKAFAKAMGATNVVYVPNGIDGRFWAPFDARENASSTTTRIVFVGRVVAAKGVEHLIEAVRKLDFAWELTIVGNGNALRSLREATRGDERIRYTGSLDKRGVRDALSQADIFVHPSLNEGLPTTILEALCCGVPTVATDAGGTSEILSLAPEGTRLVPIGSPQALAHAIADLRHALSRSEAISGARLAKRVAAEYDWDAVVHQVREIVS